MTKKVRVVILTNIWCCTLKGSCATYKSISTSQTNIGRETEQEKELFESQTKDISPTANTDRAPHLGNDAAHNQRNSRHQWTRVFKGYLKMIENMCHYGKQLSWEPLVVQVVISLTRT